MSGQENLNIRLSLVFYVTILTSPPRILGLRNDCDLPAQINVFKVQTEMECNLKCVAQWDCASYYFKNRKTFDNDANAFSGNCVLLNKAQYEHGMMIRETPAKYKMKICVKLPHHHNKTQASNGKENQCFSVMELSILNYVFPKTLL